MAKSARAVSIAPAALEALKSSTAGVVHSVFERTFNILIGGALVGVVRSDISLHPIDMRTDVPPGETMPSLGVKKGMPVLVQKNKLLVGNVLEISLANAEVWRPPTQVKKMTDYSKIKRDLDLVKKTAVSKARAEGLGQLLGHVDAIARGEVPAANGLNDVAKTALPQIVDLVNAVRRGEISGVEIAAKRLVGLGPGLTPSVDDMLSGFMGAIWWVSRSMDGGVDLVGEINQAITGQTSGTTMLSRQLLQHAARGEVNERVGELLQALLGGERSPSEIEQLAERVMRIGETSGIDMMVGLLLGVRVGLVKNEPPTDQLP